MPLLISEACCTAGVMVYADLRWRRRAEARAVEALRAQRPRAPPARGGSARALPGTDTEAMYGLREPVPDVDIDEACAHAGAARVQAGDLNFDKLEDTPMQAAVTQPAGGSEFTFVDTAFKPSRGEEPLLELSEEEDDYKRKAAKTCCFADCISMSRPRD
mmetsp:Transcript_90505/g.256488  ORF Transcript_90505/g.256488 Transcript_90505/m.256488 type:complete len:160 (-) Transcript_90505:133-612(-)